MRKSEAAARATRNSPTEKKVMQSADRDAIDRVLSRYVETWRAHDMDAWGRLFTDDADFISHTGGWWKSNRENVAGHKAIPDSVIPQKARYRLATAKISFLTTDVALVHATWEWSGFIPSPGEAPVDRKGIITMVMTKHEDRWLIRASQNTRIE
jgi:uncharacterized protein (TIGR02246 family)